MRASKAGVIAGLALLAVAPLPLATAMSATAATSAPGTLPLDELDETVDEGTGIITDPVDEILPPKEPEDPVEVPKAPEPEPEVVAPKPKPKPPTTTAPKPAPAPVPKPVEDKVSGSDSGSGSGSNTGSKSGASTGGGAKPSTGSGSSVSPGGTGASSGTGLGPTLLGTPLGPEFASANPNASSIYYSGASPLLPEANAADPNISSLLIAGGQQSQGISPVADDTAGSVTGLLVLGTLASLMLYGSAAYLKFGKRRSLDGRHKA